MKKALHKKQSSLQIMLLCFAVILLFCHGCYFDNAEALYPSYCPDEISTLSNKVRPILQQSCYSCHDAENANSLGAGIQLEDYDRLLVYVNNGQLLGSIEHRSGFSPMPKGNAKLSACDIEAIQNWISNGAQND